MCGNGIRCLAKYVYDQGLTRKTEIRVETRSGIRDLRMKVKDHKVYEVQADMGRPELAAARIPVLAEKEQAVDVPAVILGKEYRYTAVSMGNPHAVVFAGPVEKLDLETLGPEFEHYPAFPDRINTEFVEVTGPDSLRMRVWERGSGETLACGTGACAAAVAAVLLGKVRKDQVEVRLRGGVLKIFWDRGAERVWMTGPAVTVFQGEIQGIE